MIILQPSFPVALTPVTHLPVNRDLSVFEKHRIHLSGGVVNIYIYLIEDKTTPILLDAWTPPEFKTLICSGIYKFVFEWVSGTPKVSMKSYN